MKKIKYRALTSYYEYILEKKYIIDCGDEFEINDIIKYSNGLVVSIIRLKDNMICHIPIDFITNFCERVK